MVVTPGMVRAREPVAVTPTLRHDLSAPMATHVKKGAYCAVFSTSNENRYVEDGHRFVVMRVGDLCGRG